MAKRKIFVKMRGRDTERAEIYKTTWNVRGKKKNYVVALDRHGNILSRSTKYKTISEAAKEFKERGTFNKNLLIHYNAQSKKVTKLFTSEKQKEKFYKTPSGEYQSIEVIKAKGEYQEGTSNKFSNSIPQSENRAEAERRAYSLLAFNFGLKYNEAIGRKLALKKNWEQQSGILYFVKRKF